MDFDFVQSKMEAINQKVSYMLNKSHLRDFQLLSREVAPEGVKPIARSVSWLIQQVVTQNLKRYSQELGFSSIEVPQTKSLTNETYNDIEIFSGNIASPLIIRLSLELIFTIYEYPYCSSERLFK